MAFAVALDLYIPVVPQMVHLFKTTKETVQLTLSVFMIVSGIGQLFIGPLSDEFGRRNTILASTLLFTLASLGAAFSLNIEMLIGFRAIQAFGSCGMLVASFAYVRDISHGKESGKIFSYLNGAIGLSPLFAPLIGGYLIAYFNWQASFFLLALFGLLTLLLCASLLKETHKAEHRIKVNRTLFARYLKVLKNPHFMAYTLASSAGIGCFFTFFSISPYLLIEHLGVKMEHFGFYFGFVGLIYFVGSFASAHIIEKIGVMYTTLIGCLLLFLTGAVMLTWYLLFGLSDLGFTLPMGIFGFGCAMAMGGGTSGALEPFPEIAGAASAMLGALQFCLAFLTGSLVVLFPVDTAIPMSCTLLFWGALSSLPLIFLKRDLFAS